MALPTCLDCRGEATHTVYRIDPANPRRRVLTALCRDCIAATGEPARVWFTTRPAATEWSATIATIRSSCRRHGVTVTLDERLTERPASIQTAIVGTPDAVDAVCADCLHLMFWANEAAGASQPSASADPPTN